MNDYREGDWLEMFYLITLRSVSYTALIHDWLYHCTMESWTTKTSCNSPWLYVQYSVRLYLELLLWTYKFS